MKLSKNQKRLGGLGVAALLVAGAVGTGAVTTLYTSLGGHVLEANVPEDGVDPEGALVRVVGDDLSHDFDLTVTNDYVEGTWTVVNDGNVAATFDGRLAPATGTHVDGVLAENLDVYYRAVDASGTPTGPWLEAGTLANPESYASVAAGGGDLVIEGGSRHEIPVRIVLEDPRGLTGAGNDENLGERLVVDATFTVGYVLRTA